MYPLADFQVIKELTDLSSISGPDVEGVTALVSDLPVPQDGYVEGISVEYAVQVCLYIT